jgi:hypothetical protein
MAEDNGDKKSEVLLKGLVAVDVKVDTLPIELVDSEVTKPVGCGVFLTAESWCAADKYCVEIPSWCENVYGELISTCDVGASGCKCPESPVNDL